jgi:hypothetical protein
MMPWRAHLFHYGAGCLLRRQADGGGVMRLMRCAGCGKPVAAAWLVTGPTLNERVRPRRVPLLGAEARG